MRDLVDIGGYEADCGDSKPKAEIVSDSGYYCVMVGNNCIARYDQQSDDYAYTHAREAAEKWNAEACPLTQEVSGVTTRSEATQAARPLDRNVKRVAALFVQPDGCYAGLPDVDAWPEQRDARRYAGPLPVVAHPPCQLWGAMANVNYARWGGEHNKPGNDGGCFAAALESVRRFGGVLEHPAKTMAWSAHGLPKPKGAGWQRTTCGGWVCEVWQSAYGHRANKATWLYYCGTNPPFELRWNRPKGTHQIGYPDQRGKAANKPTLGKREANATPLEFRDELLRLAMLAHNAEVTDGPLAARPVD